MASILTTAMDKAVRRQPETCAFVVRLYSSGAPVAYLSDHPLSLRTAGAQAYPWIARWGSLKMTASGAASGLQPTALQWDVLDHDESFSGLFGTDWRGALADLLLVSDARGIAASDYEVLWAGRVLSAVPGGGLVKFTGRPRDAELQGDIPRSSVNLFSFPALPSGSNDINRAQPVLLGTHSAEGYAGDEGMCRAVKVGPLTYLCGAGRIPVDRVYSDGVLKLLTTDYSVALQYSSDLRIGTVIVFVADQTDKEITFDARGLTADGTQDGSTVSAPGSALSLLLNLFAWEDWHDGAYPTGAPISSARISEADAFLAALGHSASYYLSGDSPGTVAVQQFADSYQLRAWWDEAGQLSIGALDHRTQGDDTLRGPGAPDSSFEDDLVLDADMAAADEPEPVWDEQALARAARVRVGYAAKAGTYQHERVVRVGTEPGDERTVECRWTPSSPLSDAPQFEYHADSTVTADYDLTGGATFLECVEASGDGKTARTNSTAGDCLFRVSMASLTQFVTIDWVELRVRARHATGSEPDDTLKLGVRIGSTDYYGAVLVTDMPADWVWYVQRWENPPDAPTEDWTKTKVDAADWLGLFHPPGTPAGDKMDLDEIVLRVQGYPAAVAYSPLALDIGSRLVHRFGQELEQLEVAGLPLRFFSLSLLAILPVVWRRRGWLDRIWSREPFAVVSKELGPGAGSVKLLLEPLRSWWTTLRADFRTTVDALPYTIGQGVLLVTAGAAIAHAGGPTCVESPAGEGIQAGPLVKTLLDGFPAGRRGLACHGAHANLLPDNVFSRGTLGWTLTQPDGTIVADTTQGRQALSDPTDSANVLLFTAGSPHTGESTAASTATASIAANTKVTLQVWRRDLGDAPLSLRLQRGFDSNWWRASDNTWQASQQTNALPLTASLDAWYSAAIDVGGSATTLTLTLVQPAGGTAGRQSCVAVAQIDDKAWPGPVIPGAATPLSIAARTFTIANDCADGIYTWPPTRGSWYGSVRVWWNASDLAAATELYFCRLRFSNGNEWHLAYVVGTGWRARARSAGVNYDAVVEGPAGAPTRFATIGLEISYTGADGDESPLEMTFRVTDASGSNSTTAAYVEPVLTAARLLYVGSTEASANHIEGDVIELRNSPLPADLD